MHVHNKLWIRLYMFTKHCLCSADFMICLTRSRKMPMLKNPHILLLCMLWITSPAWNFQRLASPSQHHTQTHVNYSLVHNSHFTYWWIINLFNYSFPLSAHSYCSADPGPKPNVLISLSHLPLYLSHNSIWNISACDWIPGCSSICVFFSR